MAEPAAAPSLPSAPSVDPAEVARFQAQADAWWDPAGEFKPLHRLNPLRLGYVRDRVAAHFGRDPLGPRPLEGLRLIDIGCGGGLVAEPMARLGAQVVAIDAAPGNIEIARLHAQEQGLAIDYRQAAAEDLAAAGERFDVVLSLEIVEHVADLESFFAAVGTLAKPGAIIVASTLNRTAKAYALAIVGAERVLRWLPAGTHDWRKFVRPSELAAGWRRAGIALEELKGMVYTPWRDEWALGDDLGVNYLAVGTRR